jgi:hypothetical protein
MPNYKYIVDFIANTKKFNDEVQTAGRTVGKVMGAVAGVAAGVFSVGAVMSFAKASTEAYNEAAQNEMALLVALKGRADVQARLIDQANELSQITLFEDDEIIRAQSLVAAFVKEESAIKTLMPAIMDLASAKKMDLASAADLVTKSFAGEMNALGRYGISLDSASGTTARLEEIQLKLNNAFGGQAEAAAKVGTAAIQQLSNEYGNLQEVIGNLLVSQSNQEGSFVKILTEATRGVSGFLGKVATWSQAGLGLKQSIMGAIWGDDEDTKKLGVVMADYQAKQLNLQKSAEKSAVAVTKQADAQKQYTERVKETYELMATVGGADATRITTPFAAIDTTTLGDLGPWSQQQAEYLEYLSTKWWELEENTRAISESMGAGFAQIGQSMVESLGLADEGFQGFLGGMLQTVSKLIAMMLSQSIANAIAGATASGAATGPLAIFTTPAFIATAVGGVLGAFAAIPKFAEGGIVSGPTIGMMGEYPGAGSNPEVIAPLDKLRGMMGTQGRDRVIIPTVKIKKGDIYIAYHEAEKELWKRT